MTVTDHEPTRRSIEGVVTDDGALVVSADDMQGHGFVPGQRVRVQVRDSRARKQAYGLLAGRGTSLTREDVKAASREEWGERADG